MTSLPPTAWIAFSQHKRIAFGEPENVVARVKSFVDSHPDRPVLMLDADTSQTVEVDLRGSLATILKRLPAPAVASPSPPSATADDAAPRGPGRPKLGVVAREVTLLPRHWEWLATQPGGASVALRKLVERAQRLSAESDRRRVATEAAYRFMHALAGDVAGFEEASRVLFAGQLERLKLEVAAWPKDVRTHLLELAGRALAASPAEGVTPAPGA